MPAFKRNFIIGLGVIILLFAYTSLFTVQEGQQALVLKMGKLVTNNQDKVQIYKPGLHVKVPLISQALKFDMRLQTLDVQSSRVLTAEQKYVLVDYYIKWRIADLPLYYRRTLGVSARAENLLQQKVNDALRAAFGRRTINDVVSSERRDVMGLLQQRASASAETLGIQVVDVRIKRIDLPEEVSSSVFDRMRVDREQAATKHRSDGKAAAETIQAKADAKVTVIIAEARAKAAKIRAAGDAAAAKLYLDAYGKNSAFYAFYRSLLAYQNSFNNKRDILLLQPDSEFFKYFKQSK